MTCVEKKNACAFDLSREKNAYASKTENWAELSGQMPEHKGLYMLSHGIWPVHILKAMVIYQKEVIQSNKHIKKITFTVRVRWGWGQSWQSRAGEELKHRDQFEEWQLIAKQLWRPTAVE